MTEYLKACSTLDSVANLPQLRMSINYAMFERTGYKKPIQNQCKFCYKQYVEDFEGSECTLCTRPFNPSNNDIKIQETNRNKKDKKNKNKKAVAVTKAALSKVAVTKTPLSVVTMTKTPVSKVDVTKTPLSKSAMKKKKKERKQKIEINAGLDLSGTSKAPEIVEALTSQRDLQREASKLDFVPAPPQTEYQKLMTKERIRGKKRDIKNILQKEWRAKLGQTKLEKFLKLM